MKAKRIATFCTAAALIAAQTAPARADFGDALVGGVVGGVIGGAIVNEANKKKQKTYAAPSVSSAQRAQNAEVQTSLNYFGYPAGTPDGVLGARSRRAIADYQMTLGYPGTGYLTDYERSHLVASYHRAIAGGAATAQAAATNPMGMRGLLVTWRDEAMGIVPAAPAAPATVPATAPATVPAAAPETTMATAPATGLPTFLGTAGAEVSLASFCNRVGLMTTTNGGYTTVADMTDIFLLLLAPIAAWPGNCSDGAATASRRGLPGNAWRAPRRSRSAPVHYRLRRSRAAGRQLSECRHPPPANDDGA